ncbi:hypothetical protein N0V94_009657 [Neodidymelliopsis sp. IMI 364377]|nr:hypothetical protein N0V94_009657 [Neodidymelliopsis sp. IMI 364377]
MSAASLIRAETQARRNLINQKLDQLHARLQQEADTLNSLIDEYNALKNRRNQPLLGLKRRIVGNKGLLEVAKNNFRLAYDEYVSSEDVKDLALARYKVREMERRLRVVEVSVQSMERVTVEEDEVDKDEEEGEEKGNEDVVDSVETKELRLHRKAVVEVVDVEEEERRNLPPSQLWTV